MTNPPRASDILAAHREIPNEHGASCTCGEWQSIRISEADTVGWSHACHQIDALNEAGFEIVRRPKGALKIETQTIPVFVEDVPRVMVQRGLEEVPARHTEFIPHSRLHTVWHSPECPDCANEHGIHDRRIDEYRAKP